MWETCSANGRRGLLATGDRSERRDFRPREDTRPLVGEKMLSCCIIVGGGGGEGGVNNGLNFFGKVSSFSRSESSEGVGWSMLTVESASCSTVPPMSSSASWQSRVKLSLERLWPTRLFLAELSAADDDDDDDDDERLPLSLSEPLLSLIIISPSARLGGLIATSSLSSSSIDSVCEDGCSGTLSSHEEEEEEEVVWLLLFEELMMVVVVESEFGCLWMAGSFSESEWRRFLLHT